MRELPVKNGEVDIKFDQPSANGRRASAVRRSIFFLYDIRENTKLRTQQPAWVTEREATNSFTRRRQPAKFKLLYLITAWAKDPEDEHRLLSRALMALFRHPRVPDELLPEGARGLEGHAGLQVAQEEDFPNPADLWSALDNEVRPAIACVISMTLDPYLRSVASWCAHGSYELAQAQCPSPSSWRKEPAGCLLDCWGNSPQQGVAGGHVSDTAGTWSGSAHPARRPLHNRSFASRGVHARDQG